MQAKTPYAPFHAMNEQRKMNQFYWRSPSFHFGVFFHPPKHEFHACRGILACVMTHHCSKWKMCFVCFLTEKQAWVVLVYASHGVLRPVSLDYWLNYSDSNFMEELNASEQSPFTLPLLYLWVYGKCAIKKQLQLPIQWGLFMVISYKCD